MSRMSLARLQVDFITTLFSQSKLKTRFAATLSLFSKKNSFSTAPLGFIKASLHLALPASIPAYLIAISFHSPLFCWFSDCTLIPTPTVMLLSRSRSSPMRKFFTGYTCPQVACAWENYVNNYQRSQNSYQLLRKTQNQDGKQDGRPD